MPWAVRGSETWPSRLSRTSGDTSGDTAERPGAAGAGREDAGRGDRRVGATLDGEPVVRAATAESRLALIGEYATGFDAGGPSATLCRECSRLLYADTAGDLSSLQSRHLSVEHGISAPMLP